MSWNKYQYSIVMFLTAHMTQPWLKNHPNLPEKLLAIPKK